MGTQSNQPINRSQAARQSAAVGAYVSKIKIEHEAAQAKAGEAVAHAVECGRLLLGVKSKLPHGTFETWIKNNVSFSAETARRYMRVASNRSRVTEMTSLRAALETIAAPRKIEPPAPVATNSVLPVDPESREASPALEVVPAPIDKAPTTAPNIQEGAFPKVTREGSEEAPGERARRVAIDVAVTTFWHLEYVVHKTPALMPRSLDPERLEAAILELYDFWKKHGGDANATTTS
jgi:hypothetical protein